MGVGRRLRLWISPVCMPDRASDVATVKRFLALYPVGSTPPLPTKSPVIVTMIIFRSSQAFCQGRLVDLRQPSQPPSR